MLVSLARALREDHAQQVLVVVVYLSVLLDNMLLTVVGKGISFNFPTEALIARNLFLLRCALDRESIASQCMDIHRNLRISICISIKAWIVED